MDDAFFFLLALGLALWLLVGPLVALVTARRALAEARGLRAELAALRLQPAAEPEPAQAAEPVPAAAAEAAPEIEPEPTPEAPPEPTPEPMPEPTPALRPSWEQRLAQRWLVWLGGIALALGGVFVVKAAIDQGWLGPVVRVLLAGALGVALIGMGERLRRRGLSGYVPPALAAAGVATLFAAVWAAHALYALLPGILAFALLAATAALAVMLAWSHGPFLAALGLAGAFLVPALVGAEAPAAAPLLGYLLLPTLGGLAILRYRPWPWLAWLVLVGAVPWLWLAILEPWRDPLATAAFILATAAAFLLAPGQAESRALRWAVATAAWLLAFSAFGLHVMAGPATTTSLALLLLAALPIALAWRYEIGAAAPVAAGVAMLLALLTWQLALYEVTQELTGEAEIALPPLRLLPEAATPLVAWAFLFSALFVIAGLALALRGHRPGLWATLSAGFPVLAFAVAYLRLSDFSPSLSWAGLALALAAGELLLASLVARQKGPPEALAAYAVGTAAGLALACTMALERAWLTTALSALLPAIGWVWRRLGVPGLRSAAFVLALVVLARTALDPDALLFVDGPAPRLAWSLYALGLPTLAFLAAAQLFRTGTADRLAAALTAGALLYWLLLAFAFVRWLGTVFGEALPSQAIVERALHGAIWLATAYGLLRRDVVAPFLLTRIAWAVLGIVAAVDIVMLQLLDLNPLWTGEPVGELPIFNALLLAYAVPALIAYLIARELARQGWRHLAVGTAVLSLVLALAWLGLEIRHAFHGSVLTGPLGEAESWTYSALLILAALALLAVGILRTSRALRLAGLAVLMLAVAKVFLMDLADLEGLWRAASFLGLGFSLLAIGLAYQRFVRTGEQQPAT